MERVILGISPSGSECETVTVSRAVDGFKKNYGKTIYVPEPRGPEARLNKLGKSLSHIFSSTYLLAIAVPTPPPTLKPKNMVRYCEDIGVIRYIASLRSLQVFSINEKDIASTMNFVYDGEERGEVLKGLKSSVYSNLNIRLDSINQHWAAAAAISFLKLLKQGEE